MTKSAVKYFLTRSRTFVRQIWMPLTVVSLGASAAHAGPNIWQTFETRCIAPIEEIEIVDVSGLVAKVDDTTELEIFRDPGDLYTLLRDQAGIDNNSLCRITDFDDVLAGEAFEVWAGNVVAVGKYVRIQNDSPAILMQSTAWREPRIEIEVDFLGLTGGRFLEVRETDLES